MIKTDKDDGAITASDPATWTWGQRHMADLVLKAQVTYPDHLESRNQYVREKAADKLTELWTELQEVKGRIAGLEK